MSRMTLRLRLVATVDFRHGVPFHYDQLRRKKLMRDIADDETILLISQTGFQLAFVFRDVTIKSKSGEPVHVIAHYRMQLDKHRPWSPLMLSEYAAAAGIKLDGIRQFEEHIGASRATIKEVAP